MEVKQGTTSILYRHSPSTMASAHASDYPHDDLRDDESILDDDVIEADHGKKRFYVLALLSYGMLTPSCDRHRSR